MPYNQIAAAHATTRSHRCHCTAQMELQTTESKEAKFELEEMLRCSRSQLHSAEGQLHSAERQLHSAEGHYMTDLLGGWDIAYDAGYHPPVPVCLCCQGSLLSTWCYQGPTFSGG